MTADGGLTPRNTDLHADGFFRYGRGRGLEEEDGSAIDRKVLIMYQGTARRGKFGHPEDMHRFFNVEIQVGYFYGDHVAESQMVMSDDEHAIMEVVGAEGSKAPGSFGYLVMSGNRRPAGPDSDVLAITVEVQVNGAC